MVPCPLCTKAGIYDPLNPHSRSSSQNCPLRSSNIDDYLKALLGKNFARLTVKVSLKKLLLLENEDANRFVQEVELATDLVRYVAITSMLFFSLFLLKWLEDGHLEPPPRLFTSDFLYACQQLVLGRTATGRDVPVQEMTNLFNQVKRSAPRLCVPQELLRHGTYSPMMAYLARQSSTIFVNQVVETFGSRAISWFKTQLKRHIPVSNDGLSKGEWVKISHVLIQTTRTLRVVLETLLPSTCYQGSLKKHMNGHQRLNVLMCWKGQLMTS